MLTAMLLAACPASARTLTVGTGGTFPAVSAAASVARPGDRIEIGPGTYYDCAVLRADGLLVEGMGPQTVLTDKTCEGKAILVAAGGGITVRNLTLARARVPDGNGAGIRAEGTDLLVQGVRFENNQEGLLAGDQPGGVLRIENCVFSGNGSADAGHPTASLVVGNWARLNVWRTQFLPGPAESQIRTAASLASISASRVDAAAGAGASIVATGGLVLVGTQIEAGRGPDGRHAAVLALPGSGSLLMLRGNTLQGGGTLLLNWSDRAPVLEVNELGQGGVLQSSAGAWSHRLHAILGDAYRNARHMASSLHRRLLSWWR